MAEALSDAQKIDLSKAAAKTMHATLVSVPHDVQLEAVIVLFRTLFMTHVKPEYRISMFNSVVQRMRKEIQHHLRTGVAP